MRKLIKLLLHPKKFFKDSYWFKKESLSISSNFDNIFIISHLNQLNQVETLIEHKNIINSLLVILYTNKNKKMPMIIQEKCNQKLFEGIIFFRLPNFPNNYKLKSLVYMKRNYITLLEKTKTKNLFLLSFENHYALLASNAKKRKIKLTLIDEGTATYKIPELSEYYQSQPLIKQVLAYILKIDSAFYWFKDFDTIYAAFPELLQNNFNAKTYHYFFVHTEKSSISSHTKQLINKYRITSNDFIYVNQRYAINDNDFVNTVITILSSLSNYFNTKVFIKLHPKDTDSLKKIFIKQLQNFHNIILIEENEFLIESAIQAIQPLGILGLTSTSLVYTPLISSETKVYSIKPWFINIVPKKNNFDGITLINNHYTILMQFKHIIALKNEKQLYNLDTKC